jgi:hypothetical protein
MLELYISSEFKIWSKTQLYIIVNNKEFPNLASKLVRVLSDSLVFLTMGRSKLLRGYR